MIKQFILKDFKCFKDVRINIENVTFLIGTNASGKTNAIEGMMLLSELVTGRDIGSILDGTRNAEGLIRGGSKGCGRLGSDTFTLGALLKYDDQTDLEYQIEILVSDRVGVKTESLTEIKGRNRKTMFKTKERAGESGDISVSCNNGKRGKNPEISCICFSSVISQIVSKLSTDTQYGKRIVAYSQYIISSISQILYLNPETHRMRSYAAMNDSKLKVDASNLSAVLYRLCESKENRKELLSMLRGLPENEILDIEFEKGPLNDVIFFLKEKYGNSDEKIDAMRLSDGTLRCLAILASLLGGARKSVVAIEEIDNGLHPGRAKKLIHVISEAARTREIDIIITTHNAFMLNALNREDLGGVNVVYRENSGDGSVIPFVDIPNMPALLTQGKLGDVFSSDEILRFLKEKPSAKDYSWLEV